MVCSSWLTHLLKYKLFGCYTNWWSVYSSSVRSIILFQVDNQNKYCKWWMIICCHALILFVLLCYVYIFVLLRCLENFRWVQFYLLFLSLENYYTLDGNILLTWSHAIEEIVCNLYISCPEQKCKSNIKFLVISNNFGSSGFFKSWSPLSMYVLQWNKQSKWFLLITKV